MYYSYISSKTNEWSIYRSYGYIYPIPDVPNEVSNPSDSNIYPGTWYFYKNTH